MKGIHKVNLFFVSLVVFLSAVSKSESLLSGDLSYYLVNDCEFWNREAGANGFVCVTWPRAIKVAEAESFAKKIRELEARIVQLEKKIGH